MTFNKCVQYLFFKSSTGTKSCFLRAELEIGQTDPLLDSHNSVGKEQSGEWRERWEMEGKKRERRRGGGRKEGEKEKDRKKEMEGGGDK